MDGCNEPEGETLFYKGMPTNNVEDMTKCEHLYFVIIIVIIDSAKNCPWMLKSLVKRLSGSRIFTQSQGVTF